MTKYNYSVVSKKLFDINHSNPNAKIAIIGISPGPAQLEANKNISSVKTRNMICAFANKKKKDGSPYNVGTRTNLIEMLNCLLGDKYFGIKDYKSLWEEDFDKALLTSILPYSVVRFDGDIAETIEKLPYLEDKEKAYKKTHNNKSSGFFISQISYKTIKNNKNLYNNFKQFVEKINESKSLELIIVLGTAYDVLMEAVEDKDSGLRINCPIIKIPHAAGSNGGQINAFLYAAGSPGAKKPKDKKGILIFKEAKAKLK